MRAALTPTEVCVHPFKRSGRGQLAMITACERHDPELAGWSAYTRLERADGEPFDIEELGDFDREADALLKAGEVAAALGVPLTEY